MRIYIIEGVLLDVKVCILSMQMVNNMGSLLQSYSLKRLLEEMGHDVSFLPIEARGEDDELMGIYRNSLIGEVQSNDFESRLKRLDVYFWNRLWMKVKNREQEKTYDDFRREVLGIKSDFENDCVYDWCVIGSDEVFNCCDSSEWGFTTQLFGNIREARHAISYAASCGATVVTQIPEEARKKIDVALKSLKSISVRDNNTKEFVEFISGRIPEINLDPVLIGKFDKEIASTRKVEGLPQKYCVIYAYYNRIYKKDEINAIKKFCNKYELTPIAIGMPQFWIKDFVVANPFQCLSVFKGADFVITDTFHGTIFSAKYCLRFATAVRKSNNNKLQDLIDRIDVQDHQVSAITFNELEKAYKKVHDKRKFNELIGQERRRAISYLQGNLMGDL